MTQLAEGLLITPLEVPQFDDALGNAVCSDAKGRTMKKSNFFKQEGG